MDIAFWIVVLAGLSAWAYFALVMRPRQLEQSRRWKDQWDLFNRIADAAIAGEKRILIPTRDIDDDVVDEMLALFGYGRAEPLPGTDGYDEFANRLGIKVAFAKPPQPASRTEK